MAKPRKPVIRLIAAPLGDGFEVLKPVIAKWRPSAIYAFTSLEENGKILRGHIGESWRKLYAPDKPPEIRVVPCPEPWRAETIQEMMEAFDEMLIEAEREFSNFSIEWHVGITGGTNLMPVALAFAASTHTLPVFYVLPDKFYPGYVNEPERLVVELPVFEQLGPATKIFSNSPQTTELFKVINTSSDPISVETMAYKIKEKMTIKTVRGHLTKLKKVGAVVHVGSHEYISTPVGRLAFDRAQGK